MRAEGCPLFRCRAFVRRGADADIVAGVQDRGRGGQEAQEGRAVWERRRRAGASPARWAPHASLARSPSRSGSWECVPMRLRLTRPPFAAREEAKDGRRRRRGLILSTPKRRVYKAVVAVYAVLSAKVKPHSPQVVDRRDTAQFRTTRLQASHYSHARAQARVTHRRPSCRRRRRTRPPRRHRPPRRPRQSRPRPALRPRRPAT